MRPDILDILCMPLQIKGTKFLSFLFTLGTTLLIPGIAFLMFLLLTNQRPKNLQHRLMAKRIIQQGCPQLINEGEAGPTGEIARVKRSEMGPGLSLDVMVYG